MGLTGSKFRYFGGVWKVRSPALVDEPVFKIIQSSTWHCSIQFKFVHYDFNLLICCVIYLGILNFSLLNIEFNCLRILFSFLVLRYFENISIPCCSCTVKCCATHYALVYFRSEKILTLVSLLFLWSDNRWFSGFFLFSL